MFICSLLIVPGETSEKTESRRTLHTDMELVKHGLGRHKKI